MRVMTATALAPEEALVSQPNRSTVFVARRSDLRLVKTPRYPRYGAAGAQVGEFPGECVAFQGGNFTLPPEGTVALEDGRPADVQEIGDWLRSHRLFNNPEDGFWTVEQAAPPVTDAELQRLMDAALAFDEETLERVIAQEHAGWQRAMVIDRASDALDKIRRMKAAQAEQAALSKPAAKKPAAQG